jgi:AraC-like DNA-binding protein
MTGDSSDPENQGGPLQDTVEHAHVEVHAEVRDKPVEHFDCREMPLAKLGLFDIRIDPVSIHRDQEDIARDSVDNFLLATQLRGTVLISQGESEFIQHPGELAIMDAGQPYTIVHTQKSHRLILHIPKDVYQERVHAHLQDRKFSSRKLPKGGLVNVIHNMLKSLASEAETLGPKDQYTVAEALLELTTAILRADVDHDYELQHARQSALFRRILEFMESNYMDCELTPEKVADANGISVRYLHSLFNQAGITVSKWIWERRLKATREDLIDPNMAHMRVSEIAFRRGFNDPAHFSRAFKARFDISPSKLRQIDTEAPPAKA